MSERKQSHRKVKLWETEKLPIYQHKEKLVQAIKNTSCLVVTGETGSGKTTQLPQYLHQAGKTPVDPFSIYFASCYAGNHYLITHS